MNVDRPTYQAAFSPDEKMITFMQLTSPQTAKVIVAPATGAWPISKSEWIDVTDGTQWDDKPHWSPDGNLLYFDIRARRIPLSLGSLADSACAPADWPAFAIAHFHSSRRSMLNVGLTELEVAVAPDRIVFVQGEVTGNIWLAHLP